MIGCWPSDGGPRATNVSVHRLSRSPAPKKLGCLGGLFAIYISLRACVRTAGCPLSRSPMKEPPSRALDQLPLLVHSKATLSTHSSLSARVLPARRAMVALFGLITLTYICYTHATFSTPGSFRDVDGAGGRPSLGVSRAVQQSWVMYSPYYAAEPYVSPPRGCRVDQVCPALFPFLRMI